MEKVVIQVGGMSCRHCSQAVKKALTGVHGVESVDVDLEKGRAELEVNEQFDIQAAERAIVEQGYDFEGVA
jgi:copper chaperone CopZ